MTIRRVLVTGVANFWGAALAVRLAQEPGVEVVGTDTRSPPPAVLDAIDFLAADLREQEATDRLRGVRPDAVVHNDVRQFPGPGESSRLLHDVNVIGTLNLLTACAGLPGLHTLVVRASAAIYGSEPGAPAFFAEEQAGRFPLRTRFQRDLGELEAIVGTFARRHPAVTCTLLRLQPVVGTRLDTPITRLFRLPVVPTVLGFDPRLQLLHEHDSVEALAAALHTPVRGAVNVAGEGAVSLSRVLRCLGRPALPVAHPLYGRVGGALARAGGTRMTPDIERFLRYGRGVELRRLVGEVGFRPRFSTLAAVERITDDLRAGGAVGASA